jgi:hypothetical protein
MFWKNVVLYEIYSKKLMTEYFLHVCILDTIFWFAIFAVLVQNLYLMALWLPFHILSSSDIFRFFG